MKPPLRPDIAELCRHMGLDPDHYVEFNNRAPATGASGLGSLAGALQSFQPEAATPRPEAARAAVAGVAPPRTESRGGPPRPAIESLLPGLTPRREEARESRTATRILLVASVAPGLGTSTLAAHLARALMEQGAETVLLNDRGDQVLPLYFRGGARRKPRIEDVQGGGSLAAAATRCLGDSGWVVVDTGRPIHRLIESSELREAVLMVPLLPDLRSLAAVAVQDTAATGEGKVVYVLNQFDGSRELHQEYRLRLRDRLGASLAPVAIRRGEQVEEALARGMTSFDLAPEPPVASDYRELAAWAADQFERAPVYAALEGLL
jgi:cellulose biosynthesis protein BcsQ